MSAYETFLIGDTVRFTWINSAGVTMNPTIDVQTGSSTSVNTASMVDSGLGHFYHFWPTTGQPAGFYVGFMTGTSGSNPFKRSKKIRLIAGSVD